MTDQIADWRPNQATSFEGDLQVEPISSALVGWTIDVVVSGSIGAVESVRLIRALRRLGAEVVPWLTDGGAQFVTPLALAWAAGRDVRRHFSGTASHLATADACIIAPASASLLARLAHGLTDTPTSALVTSYLGSGRPVLAVPNMHDSLAAAPTVQRNLHLLAAMGLRVLPARLEEGKHKFPEPRVLADHAAHILNEAKVGGRGVLVTMGSTRGYIDDVRYISNYSSGALGSAMAEELYRLGYQTQVVTGACPVRPKTYTQLTEALTNADMEAAALAALTGGAEAAVLAASVLDFIPTERVSGKISSASTEAMTVTMSKATKIIAKLQPKSGIKVGFKLEAMLTPERAQRLAADYIRAYDLSLVVINDLAKVDQQRHEALLLPAGQVEAQVVTGKQAVALAVAAHVHARFTNHPQLG